MEPLVGCWILIKFLAKYSGPSTGSMHASRCLTSSNVYFCFVCAFLIWTPSKLFAILVFTQENRALRPYWIDMKLSYYEIFSEVFTVTVIAFAPKPLFP